MAALQKQGKTGPTGVHGRPSSGILLGAEHIWRAADMGGHAEFNDHIEEADAPYREATAAKAAG